MDTLLARTLHEREHELQIIIDNMPALIGCWDKELRNRFGNHAYREWFDIDPQTLPGKHISEVIGEALYQSNRPRIEAVLRGEAQVFERLIPRPHGGPPRHALTHYVPDCLGSEVRGFFVLVTDMSDVKEVEQKLRESEERYRAVLEAQTDAISRLRADGVFLYANDVYCRFFGKELSELLGQCWHPVAHPDDLPLINAKLAELSPDNPVVTIENRVYAGDGTLHWMQFINRGFFDTDGKLLEVQSVGRDVTARRQAKLALLEANEQLEQRVVERTQALRRLAVEMALAEERERREIARDLHDDLGQLLHVVRLKFDALTSHCQEGEALTLCRQLDIFLDDASSRVRSLTSQLSPPVLDQLGLLPALYWLATEMGDAYGLEVQVSSGNATCTRLEPVQASMLFRCIRELLINVARHAVTGQAHVGVVESVSEVVFVIEDSGRGFQNDSSSAGFGLASIRERMVYMGGSFEIDSQPGQGSRITLRMPLSGEG
ncbi:MAG: PAS domain-containing protein [Dechloromonas sp.]|nr:PAS domain-containing protein [Dechloromonas sp.]